MKVTMEGDGSKPKNTLPSDFRPGGVPVEGAVVVQRDDVIWHVLGTDAFGARLFAKTADGMVTGWLECVRPEQVHEYGQEEPVSVVCTCTGSREAGFTYEPDLDIWVHAECRKPKRLYLDSLIQRLSGRDW